MLTETKEFAYRPREAMWDWGKARNGEAACQVCGRRFERRSRNHVYCSKECRKRTEGDKWRSR